MGKLERIIRIILALVIFSVGGFIMRLGGL